MAEIQEKTTNGVFGGVSFNNVTDTFETAGTFVTNQTFEENVGTIRNTQALTKVGFWQKFKNFWLQEVDWNREIKVVLTPKQQKIEDEINEFLHQEITWEKVHDFLFQEVTFGKKK